jgi:hypothetical protein
MKVSMKLKGHEELKRKLGKSRYETAMRKGMTKAVVKIESEIKKRTPVKSGQLKASFTHYISPDATQGVVGTNKEYAPYVEEGTGVYIGKGRIYPRTAGALAWGDMVRTSIAGMKGRFFVKKAWREEGGVKLLKFFDAEFDKAIKAK